MAKRRLSYPNVRFPHRVSAGRGCVRTAVDDYPEARVAFLTSAAEPVTAVVETAFAEQLEGQRWIRKPAGEPDVAAVAAAAEQIAAAAPQVLVAIGGGAVLDWARLAWAAAAGALDLDAPEQGLGAVPAERPAFVLVPTTCATGAESATVAVLARGGDKVPVLSEAFLASHVLLDPQFLEGVARARLALFLCDALSHAVEAYVSIVPNAVAKELAVSGLRLVHRGFADPEAPRHQDLMLGAYFAGAAASHCSVGAAHAFAHTAAGYGIGHAHGNALALAPTLERLAAAGKLEALAAGALFSSVDALQAWIGAVTAEALGAVDAGTLVAGLEAAGAREAFLARMKADVCLRSFPLRLAEEDLAALLERILAAA